MLTASLTGEITGWATLALAFVTACLVGVAIRQATLTERALRLAESDNQEAIKSRVDQRAPRLTVVAEAAATPTSEWGVSLQSADVFDPETESERTLAVNGFLLITNEGAATAVVRIPEGFVPLPHKDESGHALGLSSLNTYSSYAPTTGPLEFFLPPMESKRLLFEIRRPLAEWISAIDQDCQTSITITSEDTFREGIHDETEVTVAGCPVKRQGEVIIANPASCTIRVQRTQRAYPSLSSPPVTKPKQTKRMCRG